MKQGREYLRHDEQSCQIEWMQKMLRKLLHADSDHMTACDRTMGDTHPCTCGADEARRVLNPFGEMFHSDGKDLLVEKGRSD